MPHRAEPAIHGRFPLGIDILPRKSPPGIEEIARAVRGHWMVESYHWHLDVTFWEDGNHTIEKQAAYNLNIMRKLSLNILKLIEVGSKAFSLKKKRYAIGTNPEKHLEQIMNL